MKTFFAELLATPTFRISVRLSLATEWCHIFSGKCGVSVTKAKMDINTEAAVTRRGKRAALTISPTYVWHSAITKHTATISIPVEKRSCFPLWRSRVSRAHFIKGRSSILQAKPGTPPGTRETCAKPTLRPGNNDCNTLVHNDHTEH